MLAATKTKNFWVTGTDRKKKFFWAARPETRQTVPQLNPHSSLPSIVDGGRPLLTPPVSRQPTDVGYVDRLYQAKFLNCSGHLSSSEGVTGW